VNASVFRFVNCMQKHLQCQMLLTSKFSQEKTFSMWVWVCDDYFVGIRRFCDFVTLVILTSC
jgi:hypothetical protein